MCWHSRCVAIACLFIEPLPRNGQCLSSYVTILSLHDKTVTLLHETAIRECADSFHVLVVSNYCAGRWLCQQCSLCLLLSSLSLKSIYLEDFLDKFVCMPAIILTRKSSALSLWLCFSIHIDSFLPYFIHSFIMVLQPFAGPWPLLQFRDLLYTY
jgi:hypothetical protein